MKYSLEFMTAKHREPVIDIFNYYIEHSFAAYPEKKVGYDFFERLLEISKEYPSIVAKTRASEIVGFAFLRPYLSISTFRGTAEITYFILPKYTRKGLGEIMLAYLVEEAQILGVQNLLASISSHNEPSLNFHHKAGFVVCGCFRDVGKKNGTNFDIVWMQKQI
jgi:phosphinothricin acetyltransferase